MAGRVVSAVSAPAITIDTNVQAVFAKSTATSGAHAVTAYMAATSGTSNSAINAVSDNPGMSAVQVSGTETNRGTVKITHRNPGAGATADASAAAVSIDLQDGGVGGTAAQGVFVTSTTGSTTGNLITARNNGRDDFVVKGSGRAALGIATGATPAGKLEIAQNDDSTVGLAMTANSASAQQMVLLKDSGGSARFEISAAGNSIHRATAFFTSAIQAGSASADLGGSAGFVLSMKNASTNPSTNPTGGGILYVSGGALLYRGSSGTVTPLAAA